MSSWKLLLKQSRAHMMFLYICHTCLELQGNPHTVILFLLLMLETSIMIWCKSNMSKTSTNSTNLWREARIIAIAKQEASVFTYFYTQLNYKPKNIVDIDAGDVDNELAQGEYVEVIYKFYKLVEVENNQYSMKIFFEIRKQKYLEALDRNDRAKAVEILCKDLKVFSTFNEELFKEITQLLTLDNFRQNEQLSNYGDTKSAQSIMLVELKKLIEANPLFRGKLAFPVFKARDRGH
ncbi:topless-related protein 2-like [Helianthus annuus]|uniref:topless-related protein 2-like n=1 Tax=Helianthus annuus TaxID=4232 RepID=UPI0016530DEE|nr:topless-related protein 2-like [Helianthus annuus]